jgi:phage terminase large subunit-like protein
MGIENLSRAQKEELARLLAEKKRRVMTRRLWTYYPDEGPLRRELYPKHCAFFAAGAKHRERCMLAGNRTGKSEGVGAFEVTLHLTGLYPDWWVGRRFEGPVAAWACGTTNGTTRDIVQAKLLGTPGDPSMLGTGMVPADNLMNTVSKPGIPNAIESATVKHVSGGVSAVGFKSYEQGRKAFEGTERDVVWLDEEPPKSIYDECLIRTMTTNGLILCTFTPLEGLTEVALSFLPEMQAA